MDTTKLAAVKRGLAALALCCLAPAGAQAAVTITIVNGNAPGIGFNDPTPVAPAGGNAGTTLGQQRLIAFTHAANLWGSTLTSSEPIRILASFEALACSANAAVLGAAGAWSVFANFPAAPRSDAWYPAALANKLAGADLSEPGEPHIQAVFNARLGLAADCLPGTPFYLGLDNAHGSAVDFVTVLLHEMAHGLGFQTFTNEESGEFLAGIPSIWDYFLLDNQLGQSWANLSATQRAASAVSGRGLSWSGANVTAALPGVLAPASRLGIAGPAAGPAAGNYEVGDASFGPPLGRAPVSGQLMPVVDQANGQGLACSALSPLNALAVRNNVALVDRGGCPFTAKAKAVQDAGAIGMVVADNAPGEVTGMGGSDPAVTIPALRITQADAMALKARLVWRSRTRSGVVAELGLDPSRLAGADGANRALMYAPGVYQPGSSVAHYSDSAKPNQLMEPAINGDLTHQAAPPRDLTLPLLGDIGW